MSDPRFSKDQISLFIARALETAGMPPNDAGTVAEYFGSTLITRIT